MFLKWIPRRAAVAVALMVIMDSQGLVRLQVLQQQQQQEQEQEQEQEQQALEDLDLRQEQEDQALQEVILLHGIPVDLVAVVEAFSTWTRILPRLRLLLQHTHGPDTRALTLNSIMSPIQSDGAIVNI